LEALHECAVFVTLTHESGNAAASGLVTVEAEKYSEEIGGLPKSISICEVWPQITSRGVPELAYRLLIELDAQCMAEWWDQTSFTE